MALYEIRTMLSQHRSSLISFGEFTSDLSAILAARKLLRLGESLEIWRGEMLVYRTGSNVRWASTLLINQAFERPRTRAQRVGR